MRRTLAGVALIALMITGCSSNEVAEGSDPGWVSSDAAIAGVNDAGFDCSEDSFSGTKQVITENPATEEPLGGELILCGGFQVFLVGDIDEYWESLSSSCSAVTEEELASEAVQREVIVGSNFVMSGTGPDQSYSEEAPASDLARAFGAEVETLKSIYETICPEIGST